MVSMIFFLLILAMELRIMIYNSKATAATDTNMPVQGIRKSITNLFPSPLWNSADISSPAGMPMHSALPP